MERRNIRMALVLAVLLMAAAAPACAEQRYAEGSFERTLRVTGAVELDVLTGSGKIDVMPGDASTVRVTAHIRARINSGTSQSEAEAKVRRLEQNPAIVQTGNSIRIGDIEDEDLRRNVQISYTITTPAETRLRSRTGSGSQSVSGIRGPVEASTGSGSLKLRNIGSAVRATAGSGSIELEAIGGDLKASTGSGGIRAAGIAGAVEASTGSGSVRVEQTAPGDVDVRTGSGGVELTGVRGTARVRTGSGSIRAEGTPTGDWSLHTSSGGVTVRLPGEMGFELRARSSSGSIESAHPVTVEGRISRRELTGKVRGGGPRIDLSTASGSIRIL
jgi:DUF4097 and DUF4098 domain-containing protein YvlB